MEFFGAVLVLCEKLGARVRRFVSSVVSVRISSQNNLFRAKEKRLYVQP